MIGPNRRAGKHCDSRSRLRGTTKFSKHQIEGFERIEKLNLSVPVLVGFGIHNRETFKTVCDYFEGAIIGSAFIKSLEQDRPVKDFVDEIIEQKPERLL